MQINPAKVEKEQLATGITLYRIDNLRMLVSTSGTAGSVRSLTLSTGDRPSASQSSIIHAAGYMGLASVYSLGNIALRYYSSYGDAGSIADIPDSWTINFHVIWGV